MKKNKQKKVKIRTAISYELFNNGLYRPKTEKGRTKYTRKTKHKHRDKI